MISFYLRAKYHSYPVSYNSPYWGDKRESNHTPEDSDESSEEHELGERTSESASGNLTQREHEAYQSCEYEERPDRCNDACYSAVERIRLIRHHHTPDNGRYDESDDRCDNHPKEDDLTSSPILRYAGEPNLGPLNV